MYSVFSTKNAICRQKVAYFRHILVQKPRISLILFDYLGEMGKFWNILVLPQGPQNTLLSNKLHKNMSCNCLKYMQKNVRSIELRITLVWLWGWWIRAPQTVFFKYFRCFSRQKAQTPQVCPIFCLLLTDPKFVIPPVFFWLWQGQNGRRGHVNFTNLTAILRKIDMLRIL